MTASESRPYQRRYPRFQVLGRPELIARLDHSRLQEKIITLGGGGCGFVGVDRCWPLSPLKRVFTRIEMQGYTFAPVEVQGNIIYMHELKVEDKIVIYYGIEFIPSDRKKIQPIIDNLEKMKKVSGF